MKRIWMTSLVSSEDTVKDVMGKLKTYGLEINGHFWEDDLEKMAWSKARGELIDPEVALWIILATAQELSTPTLLYGLSLLSLTVQAQRGLGFPIVFLLSEGQPPSPESLPTPLKSAEFLSSTDTAFGAKLVAKVHTAVKEQAADYRLDVYGNPQLGQWFEIGPQHESWTGVMMGVAGAEITFQAVGPKGSLPSKSVINYPLEGLKLTLGEKEYVAWAVQNEVDPDNSYFAKIEGFPESVVFGPYSSEEETEVHVVQLK